MNPYYVVGEYVYRIEWQDVQGEQVPTMYSYPIVSLTPQGCRVERYGKVLWVGNNSRQYGRTPAEARMQASIRAEWYERHSKHALNRAKNRRARLSDPAEIPGPSVLRKLF